MKQETLYNLLQNPFDVSITETQELLDIIQKFPYFQTAHILVLKGVQIHYPEIYNETLKKTAIYAANRSLLFNYINHQITEKERKKIETNPIITPSESPIIEEQAASLTQENTEKSIVLQDVDINEPHSFLEWLTYTSHSINKEEKQSVKENAIEKKYEIIEQFIHQNPKLSPPKNKTENANIATSSVEENQNLMTETLAKIYIEQKKYDKAIQAFQILSLKYPEKSGYFADQIKNIKNIEKDS